jgi:hypothetical protein
MADRKPGKEILIEIVTIGVYAKVSAIDPVTGTEVSLTAPANADEKSLKAAARRKLDFVLKKRAREGAE